MSVDRVICVVTLLLAAVYFYATAQIPSLEIGDPLGPKAFPRLLGAGLILSAVLLFIETTRARKNESTPPAQSPGSHRHHWLIAAVVGWTTVYFASFEKLGYVIATTVYLLVLMVYFNRGKWIANVLTSTLFCAASYLLFTKALGVTLPLGVLPF